MNIANAKSTDTYTLNYTIDDGMVVYVNGKEAGRYNMPSGTVTSSTAATTYANGNPDTGSMTIDGSLFQTGTNVIAVEVHNNQTNSSDILWNAELIRSVASEGSYVSTKTQYVMPTSGTQKLTAVWEKVTEDQQQQYADVPVKVNEVSAANSAHVNDLFKDEDWVELYNTTDNDINAAGLYLTDNSSKPTKYQIKAATGISTTIPAHGTMVVWCDGKTGTSQVHASFKLSNKAGCLVMLSGSSDFAKNNPQLDYEFASDFTDTLRYNAMGTTQSVGRFPDGGNSYYLMNHATIDANNSLQGDDTLIGTDYIDYTLYGDVNGDGYITKEDATLVVKHYVGNLPAGASFSEKAADINRDGSITVNDANIIVNRTSGEK